LLSVRFAAQKLKLSKIVFSKQNIHLLRKFKKDVVSFSFIWLLLGTTVNINNNCNNNNQLVKIKSLFFVLGTEIIILS